MGTKISDAAPQIEVLTGSVLAPGNAIHVVGWFRAISAQGKVTPDNGGPVRAFLASKPDATGPLRSALVATCTAEDRDGRWNITMAGALLTNSVVQTLADGKVAYLIIEQGTLSRVHIKFTVVDGKAATLI